MPPPLAAFAFMSLQIRVHEDMKAAMRARDGARLSAIRLLLAAYLPQQLGDSKIEQAVLAAASECGAAGAKDMGKVSALVKARLGG